MADPGTQISVRWLAEGTVREGGLDKLDEARQSGLVWVDVLDVEKGSLDELAKRFNLHPLAVEDTLHFPQRPKIDQYESSWFLVWLIPAHEDQDGFKMSELDVFLAPDFIITVHEDPLDAIDATVAEGAKVFDRGTASLFHEIVDRLVDSIMPLVDDIADRIEDIEDTMLGNPRKEDMEGLYQLRRELVSLHRVIGPERDVLRALVREREIVDDEAYRYLQDVGDHLARAEDSIETAREVAAAIMDIYLSSVSNRMNEIMKQLTVVATIFMPLTLISGIYGMNVIGEDGQIGMWPPVRGNWSFWAVVGAMLALAVTMAMYFRRKKWW